MAVVLHLLGPALRHGATRPLIELLPPEELFHVSSGCRACTSRPKASRSSGSQSPEVESNTHLPMPKRARSSLGADGAMPPPHDDYLWDVPIPQPAFGYAAPSESLVSSVQKFRTSLSMVGSFWRGNRKMLISTPKNWVYKR